jgi:hypothetical protein
MNPNLAPSEAVVSQALGTAYLDFCEDSRNDNIFKKFMRSNIDVARAVGVTRAA